MVTTSGSPAAASNPASSTPAATSAAAPTMSCKDASVKAKWDSVWMGGAPDWAALTIALSGNKLGGGVEAALAMAGKELDHWRSTLRDGWNIHGITSSLFSLSVCPQLTLLLTGITANDGYSVDGQPWCTAHYVSR